MLRGILTKYAHIASLLVIFGFTSSIGLAQAERIYICHFSPGNGYELIIVPPQAMSGHFDASGNPLHQGDYISNVASCDGGPSPTPTPDDPDPVPEPITMLLFGAGVTGAGFAVRRLRRKNGETQE